MTACRGCGQQICSCHFIDGCEPASGFCAHVTGNGRSYSPFNYRPNNVPLPRPYGHLYRYGPVDQVFPASTTNPVIFNSGSLDSFTPFEGGMIDTTVFDTDRLTVPANGEGYYLMYGFINLDTPTNNGQDTVFIRKNGSQALSVVSGNIIGSRSLLALEPMSPGDFIQLVVTSPAGGDTTTEQFSVTYSPFFIEVGAQLWAQWVRPL